jgi:hypothetical protein
MRRGAETSRLVPAGKYGRKGSTLRLPLITPVGVEHVPLEIGRKVGRPVRIKRKRLGQRQIGAPLTETEIIGQSLRILLRMGVVMGITVRELETDGGRIMMADIPFPSALEEGILVGLALCTERKAHSPADYRPREASFRAESIQHHIPVSPQDLPLKAAFQTQITDI